MYVNSAYEPYPYPDLGLSLDCMSRGVGCLPCGMGGCSKGLGLFATPFDLASYTWQEWALVGVGAIVLISVFSTGKRVSRTVGRKARYIAGAGKRRRLSKASKLYAQAERLKAA